MSYTLRRRTLLKSVAGVAAGLASSGLVHAQSNGSWRQYQFDPANTGSSSTVRGPSNGIQLNWETQPASDGITTHPTLVDDKLFVGSWDDHIYALDALTGDVIWKRDIGSSINRPAPAIGAGRVIVGTEEGTLYALTVNEGRIDWTFNTGSSIFGSATVVDGTVYVPNMAGTLVALSEESGSERWKFERSGIEPMMTTPAVKDGTVYIGSMVFNEIPEDQSSINPLRIEGKEMLEGMDAEGRLYAIKTADGSLRWETQTDHVVVASPVVSDGTVFLGSWDRFCYALSPDDGSERWRVSLPDVITAPPVLVDDHLYVGTWDGEINALRIDNGTSEWRTNVEERIIAPPTSDGTNLYVTNNQQIVALRLQDGARQWTFDTQAWEVEAPAIGDGMVYGTDGHGRVFGIGDGPSVQLEARVSGSDNRAISGDRGFFTNSGNPSIDALTNPFVLTIGGFVLSVIGIVHQMVSGR